MINENMVVLDQPLPPQIDTLCDLFCGCGGSGGGLLDANDILDRNVQGTFVNHWDKAIKIHSENHPEHRHLEEDLFKLDPALVFPAGTACSLLWASPSCTHFSVARGATCVNEQDRSHAFSVTHWVKHLNPEAVICENVKEFLTFGPTVQKRTKSGELLWAKSAKPVRRLPNGHARRRSTKETEAQWTTRMLNLGYTPYEVPDPKRKGEYFDAWIEEMHELGYESDHRLLRSADYGDPTIRQRLFVYFVRKDSGKKIVWPKPTHAKPDNDGNTDGLRPWRTARQIIDWSLRGASVFTRKKSLADNTFRRLAIGLVKYGLKDFLTSPAAPGKKASDAFWDRLPDLPGLQVDVGGRDFTVELHNIFVEEAHRGKGVASKALDLLVEVADEFGAIVELEVGGDSAEIGLIEFYMRYGFQFPEGANFMRRTPKVVRAEGVVQSEAYIIPKDAGHKKDWVKGIDQPVSSLTCVHTGEGLAEPSIIQMKGQSTAQSVDAPLTAVTGTQAHYVSQPMIDNIRGTGVAHSVDSPLSTTTSGGQHQAIAEAFMFAIDQTGGKNKNDGTYPIDEPVRTLVTKANQTCIELEIEQVSKKFLTQCAESGVDTERATTFLNFLVEELKKRGKVDAKPWIYVYYSNGSEGKAIDEPLPTVRTKAGHALVYPVIELDGQLLKIDLIYRMLTPLELQRAMGFPDDMKWSGITKTDRVRAIGNSVSRGVARALGLSWYSQKSNIRQLVKHIYDDHKADTDNEDGS